MYKRKGEGWKDLNLLVVEDREEKKVPREERWSRQLRHYIPNRKRDKANKTLSGRRSANRTLGEERWREWWDEKGKGGEREGGGRRKQRELKLGTKVLTFVPSKVFQIMVVMVRRGRRGWQCEEDLLWFIPYEGFGIIKLSGTEERGKMETMQRASSKDGKSLYCN